MKKFSKLFLILLSIILAFNSLSCGFRGDSFSVTAFGSPAYVEVYDKPLTEEVKTKIKDTLSALELEFSVNIDGSTVKNINENIDFTLSPSAKDVIEKSQTYYEFSNQKFNPAVYPLNKLWHFAKGTEVEKEQFSPPTDEELNTILNSGVLDYSALTINGDKVQKSNPNVEIDFGGMLKGYASQIVMDILLDNGYSSGYVSLGTSSISLLSVEKLSLRHPQNANKLILELNCKEQQKTSVSTSGNYEKYYEYDGKVYSHILDTSTGKPYDNKILSATILSKDSAFADAMTTALCLCEHNVGQTDSQLTAFMKKIIEFDSSASIYVVYGDGQNKQIITNKKQGKDFALLDNSFSIVNI